MAARTRTPYRDGEALLAEPLLDVLSTDMLLLADRGFFSYALWHKASATGADLLWRVRVDGRGAHTRATTVAVATVHMRRPRRRRLLGSTL